MIHIQLFELFGTITLKDDGFNRGVDDALSKVNSLTGSFSGIGASISTNFTGPLDAMVGGLSSGLSAFGSHISGVATAFADTTMGVLDKMVDAVAMVGTASVKLGMDYEAQMSKVQAISGASASEMELLGDKAKEMGAKTKFSASESGQAFEFMAMA